MMLFDSGPQKKKFGGFYASLGILLMFSRRSTEVKSHLTKVTCLFFLSIFRSTLRETTIAT